MEVWLVNAAHIKSTSRRNTDVKDAEWIAQLLSAGVSAYAAAVRSLVAVMTPCTPGSRCAGRSGGGLGRLPDAETYLSHPGLGPILGARVLAEFGDDPHRYADAKGRKNYSAMAPITRASGLKRTVLARPARNRPLGTALYLKARRVCTAALRSRRHEVSYQASSTRLLWRVPSRWTSTSLDPDGRLTPPVPGAGCRVPDAGCRSSHPSGKVAPLGDVAPARWPRPTRPSARAAGDPPP